MKYFFATLLLLAGSIAAFGQDREVEFNVSILEQQSCSANSITDILRLVIRLRYVNVSKRKLILYRGNRIFYQAIISRMDETAIRRQEFRTSHAAYYDKQPEKIESKSPDSLFTILPPGASHDIRQTITVPLTKEGVGHVNVSIGAGEHLLNMVVSTWYESRKLGESLRERWRSKGVLLTDPLISNSVGFVVKAQDALPRCL